MLFLRFLFTILYFPLKYSNDEIFYKTHCLILMLDVVTITIYSGSPRRAKHRKQKNQNTALASHDDDHVTWDPIFVCES